MTSMIYITLNFFIVLFLVLNLPKKNIFKRNEQEEHLTNEQNRKKDYFDLDLMLMHNVLARDTCD